MATLKPIVLRNLTANFLIFLHQELIVLSLPQVVLHQKSLTTAFDTSLITHQRSMLDN